MKGISVATETALCFYPLILTPETRGSLLKISSHKKSLCKKMQRLKICKSCRGRDRTFTRQLAIVQSSVVDPGRIIRLTADKTALCYVYPVILTPETRGHVCHACAISSPHNLFRSVPDCLITQN